MRWGLFVVLALGLVAYSFWLYLRVELQVPATRRLALSRAMALLVVLALLFDVRLPAFGASGAPARWVLLDASLSMTALGQDGSSAWEAAASRAQELEREGWTVVAFGGGAAADFAAEPAPTQLRSLLTPALDRAAEAGVDRVRVLSDFRLEDAVAVRSALASLPLAVEFERFGVAVVNAGVSGFEVPDLARPDGSVTAQVEVHGGSSGDSLTVSVHEEDREVAQVRVAPPSEGLRLRVPVELPTPGAQGRVRYSATVSVAGDVFPSDDEVVRYATVGHEEGALVLVSLAADWEPRYLLPVMEEVTGLPGLAYLRAGSDRFVPMGRAVARGTPVDSSSVRRTATEASVLVLHGLGAGVDAWARSLASRQGRTVIFARDAEGAQIAGVTTGDPRDGEWYVSAEVPASPVAGALSGVALQGLPPLTEVLLPTDPSVVRAPLLVQLRGAGSLEAAIHLDDRPQGRVAVVLSSGFWRWAAREAGREAYRSLWSGVAGWLLSGEAVAAAEPRPTEWVVARGAPVTWSVPADSVERRIVVTTGDSVVVDTTVVGAGRVVTGVLAPGAYTYRVEAEGGEPAGGRFDVAEATAEMVPAAEAPEAPSTAGPGGSSPDSGPGSPLRTRPWPYLLVITLLCAEWIGRRRSGLR